MSVATNCTFITKLVGNPSYRTGRNITIIFIEVTFCEIKLKKKLNLFNQYYDLVKKFIPFMIYSIYMSVIFKLLSVL
jgi:hypothetical protein